jgi:hypothetical protein
MAGAAPIERPKHMIDLYKFFINPHDDIRINLDNLISYTGTHLQAMVLNNPGTLFDQRITATTTALSGLNSMMSDNESKLGLRMTQVHAKEAFRQALPENLLRIQSAIIAAFGPDSPEAFSCFPKGRTPFITCKHERLDEKLEALLNSLTPLAGQVGIAHVSNVSGLRSTWIALTAALKTASVGKSSSESARRDARAALQLELFKNLLALAAAFPNDIEKAKLYCPQHLLENPEPSKQEGEAAA